MNENTEPKALMGRVTALEIIARMAYRRDLSPDDVTALQMGARAILKHHFQHERNRKRHREALAAPPEAAPTRVAPSGGAASSRAPVAGEPRKTWSMPCAVALEDRVRYVCFKMQLLDRELSEMKEAKVGRFGIELALDGWMDILEGNPTGWEPKVREWLANEARQDAAPPKPDDKPPAVGAAYVTPPFVASAAAEPVPPVAAVPAVPREPWEA